MVGRQLESEEEVQEVAGGKHGSQNDLRRLQLTLVIIPTEVIHHAEIQDLSLHTMIKIQMQIQIQIQMQI